MTYDTSNRKERKFSNWGEYICWIYANMNMCMAAIARQMDSYNRYCFMIRAKAFKAYKDGRWHINSLYKNNNWKMDLGKLCHGDVWPVASTVVKANRDRHFLPLKTQGDVAMWRLCR